MKAVFVQEGKSLDYTPSDNVAAGDVLVLGGRTYVAHRPIVAGELGAITAEGVYDVVKAANEAMPTAYTAVYWDDDGNPQGGIAGSGCLTATSAGNTFFGYTLAAAGATDETVRVLKVPATTVTTTIYEAFAAPLVDPGDGGAIPVTQSGNVPLVTGADAETRTLADPTFAGQVLALSLKTDGGGDCVITVASPINAAGNNTVTLDDAGDSLVLIGVAVGDNLAWRILTSDGATLSTV